MKYYVITFKSIDSVCCYDDGVFDSNNGGLYSNKLFKSKEEAFAEMKSLVEADAHEATSSDGCYSTEDGYSYEIETLNSGLKEIPDLCLTYYYEGDAVNEIICRVEEVEE